MRGQASDASQPEWVVRCHFDSAARAYNWLNSATRQDYLNSAADLFDGPGTQQIIVPDEPDEKVSDALVTVMVTHKVADDKVDEFRAWQDEMLRAKADIRGFGVGGVPARRGVQDDWVICYRYDSAEHLDAWLTSEDRKNLFNRPEFADFHLRRIDHPPGSWFTYGVNDPAPSDWKTSLAVWFGLYPTVVILEVLSRQLHLHMKFWLDMLVGVVAGNVMMIYLTMPYYGNRVLHWWLNPAKNARQPATNIGGTLWSWPSRHWWRCSPIWAPSNSGPCHRHDRHPRKCGHADSQSAGTPGQGQRIRPLAEETQRGCLAPSGMSRIQSGPPLRASPSGLCSAISTLRLAPTTGSTAQRARITSTAPQTFSTGRAPNRSSFLMRRSTTRW